MDAFADALLSWYESSRRVLPWREVPTPYHVFLSEIMLQQTRVDTVIAYYRRFLETYPSFNDLAKAKEEDVLLLWQGLGYYSRAKNLLKAAQEVARRFHGELPSSREDLLSLPGVGEYVASAVRAIAFDEKDVAVDGNLLRVYARVEAKPIDLTKAQCKKDCAAFYGKHMAEPNRFNQALMDLGELVCLPHGEPKCAACPLHRFCKASKQGNPLDYPPAKKKSEIKKTILAVLLCFDEKGRINIRKRPKEGLLASLYEFPNVEEDLALCDLRSRFPQAYDFHYLGEAKHRFSHIEWTMKVYEAKGAVEGCEKASMDELKKRYSLPTAFMKLLDSFS